MTISWFQYFKLRFRGNSLMCWINMFITLTLSAQHVEVIQIILDPWDMMNLWPCELTLYVVSMQQNNTTWASIQILVQMASPLPAWPHLVILITPPIAYCFTNNTTAVWRSQGWTYSCRFCEGLCSFLVTVVFLKMTEGAGVFCNCQGVRIFTTCFSYNRIIYFLKMAFETFGTWHQINAAFGNCLIGCLKN